MTLSAPDIEMHENGWNAVYTKHQHEKTVAESLSGHAFEVFLPTYISMRKWSDRRQRVSLPLFPCYVFLRATFERRLQLLRTPGVHFLVMFAGAPATIPAVEINAIRKAVESGFRVEPHPFLRSGDWVRVKSGPLADVEGIFLRRKGFERLILSCGLLGKSVSVELDAYNVTRISRQSAQPRISIAHAPTQRLERAAG